MKTNTLVIISAIVLLAMGAVSCRTSSVSKTKTKTTTKTEKHSGAANSIVKTARNYIGTPYKYGGIDNKGMDCSGLVFTCFKSQHIALPRSSKEQSLVGQEVEVSEMRPGDLVFFCEKKGKKVVDHVGIVSEVNGKKDIKFIHSSTKLGVVESDFFADYYYSVFLFAKRVTN